MARDLAQVIDAHGGRADVLGHSMGGKAAMVLALTRPELVDRLIVADIAPVAYQHSQLEFLDAMAGLDLSGLSRRSEADTALTQAVPDAGVRAFLLQSLTFDADGPKWALNLPALRAAMPQIMGFPEGLGQFDGPTLMLSGGASDYVLPDHWSTIRAHFPNAASEVLDGAGHWVHAEAPGPFMAAVAAFLQR